MSLAMVWERTSQKLYNDLYASGLFCLPINQTLRSLTSALSVRRIGRWYSSIFEDEDYQVGAEGQTCKPGNG